MELWPLTWREIVLVFLFLGIIVGFICLIRAHLAYDLLVKLRKEELAFLKQREQNGKASYPLRRDDTLSEIKMTFMFWIPLKKFERPLSDFYKD